MQTPVPRPWAGRLVAPIVRHSSPLLVMDSPPLPSGAVVARPPPAVKKWDPWSTDNKKGHLLKTCFIVHYCEARHRL